MSALICVAQCHRQLRIGRLCLLLDQQKPHLSSVLVLATPVRRRLRHRHSVHPEFDPGGSFS